MTSGAATQCPEGRQEAVTAWGTLGEGLDSFMMGHGLCLLPPPVKPLKNLGTLCWRNACVCLWDFLLQSSISLRFVSIGWAALTALPAAGPLLPPAGKQSGALCKRLLSRSL